MAVKLDPPFKTPMFVNGVLSTAWALFLRALIRRQEMIVDHFATNGALTEFTLTVEPKDENHVLAFVNGSYQPKSAFSILKNKIVFSAAPASGWLEVTTHGR